MSGSGLEGLGARAAGGRGRDPCYDLGPSFATSYSGIHINHRQIITYQATGNAMRYPQFKCWNSSVRRSRTYFPLISNGVSQHRCIRGKGAELGTNTWPQWYTVKMCTDVEPRLPCQVGNVPLSTRLTFASRGARHPRMPRNMGAQPPWINRASGSTSMDDATRRGFRKTWLRNLGEPLPALRRLLPGLLFVSQLPPSTKGEDPMVWYDR